jgi:hypothetical protein
MIAAAACRELAGYIERSGAASDRVLRRVAACLLLLPCDHPMRRDPRDGGHVDRIAEMAGIILEGKAKALALLLFAHDLEVPW